MASVRKALRKYIQAVLKNDIPEVSNRVYTNREYAYDMTRNEAVFPAINIVAAQEASEMLNQATLSYARTLTFSVVIFSKADANIDDILDDLADKVENSIMNLEVSGALDALNVNSIRLASSDLNIELGDALIGAVAIGFEVRYDTRYEPQNLDDLERVHLKIAASIADPDNVLFESEIELDQ